MASPEENEAVDSQRLQLQLEKLKVDYDLLLKERNRIAAEISSLGEALTDCQRSRAEAESALRRIRSTETSASFGEATSSRIAFLEQELESLSKANSELERLLLRSLMEEPGIKDKLREFVFKQGSLKSRILLLLSERGRVEIGEIVKLAGLDQLAARRAVEALLEERAVEAHGSLLTIPGGLRPPPVEIWRTMTIDKVFDEVEKYCYYARNPETVAQALQALKDNVEEKVRTRGTLIFEIGKEIQEWKKGIALLENLRLKLIDWKSRIQ